MPEPLGPLILYSVYGQADPTHIQCLHIEFVVTISMVLVIWPNRDEGGSVDVISTWKPKAKRLWCKCCH